MIDRVDGRMITRRRCGDQMFRDNKEIFKDITLLQYLVKTNTNFTHTINPLFIASAFCSSGSMEAIEWFTRKGEDVFYVGRIGQGGYGEIYEVTISLFIG